MSKETDRMQAEINALRAAMARAGIALPLPPALQPEERADYIAHGSPEHAALLGVIVLTEQEAKEEKDRPVVRSAKTGVVYTLEDPITPFMHYPDPQQIARLVLRQKVSELEAGAPPVPDDAPPMFEPSILD